MSHMYRYTNKTQEKYLRDTCLKKRRGQITRGTDMYNKN